MAIVYLHKRNDTGKVFYVGIGNSTRRAFSKGSRNKHWHNIVNKCGYTIEITHTNIIWKEACSIEKYLISFFRELNGKDLCNLNDGGNGNLGYVFPDDIKKKISESGKISQNNKDVIEKRIASIKKYYQNPENREKNKQKQKDFYKKTENIEAARKRTIQMHLDRPDIGEKISLSHKKRNQLPEIKEKKLLHVAKVFHSKEAKLKSLETRRKPEIRLKLSNSLKKAIEEGRLIRKGVPVLQYDKDGNFIREWNSIVEASKNLNLFQQNISTCCRGKSNICGGFIWRYKNSTINVLPYIKKLRGKKINQFTKDGVFIKTWNSANEIEKELKIYNVYLSCKNKVTHLGGFKWQYANKNI